MGNKNNAKNPATTNPDAKFITRLKKNRRWSLFILPFMAFACICGVAFVIGISHRVKEAGDVIWDGEFFLYGLFVGTAFYYLVYLGLYMLCENLADFCVCWRGWQIEDLFLKYFDQFNAAAVKTTQTETANSSDNPYGFDTTPEKDKDTLFAEKTRKARKKYRKQRPIKIICSLVLLTLGCVAWKVLLNCNSNNVDNKNADELLLMSSLIFGLVYGLGLGITLSYFRLQIRCFAMVLKSYKTQDLLFKYYDLCDEAST